MAQEQKKSRDEEIIDLTEVIEEGDPGLAKPIQDREQESDDDFNDDLKDLFDSRGTDQEDGQRDRDSDLDKEFEDLFKEHSEQEAGSEEKAGQEESESDYFLKELMQEPGSSPEEDADKPDSRQDEHTPQAAPVRETGEVDKSALSGVEHLAQQMENMEERMDKLQAQMDLAEEEFAGRVLQTLEEKGSQLGFIREMMPGIVNQAVEKGEEKIQEKLDEFKEGELQDMLSRLALLEEKVAGIQLPDIQELQDKLEPKIDEKIQSALAQQKDGAEKEFDFEGLKQELHQELENKFQESISGITDSAAHKTTEQVQQEMDSLRQNELQDLNSRMNNLEKQLSSLDTPDIQSLEDELQQKVNQALESAKPPHEETPDLSSLKEEVVQRVESRIQELVSTWQSEKKSLAAELENALTFWGRMQEKLTELSQDIGELKDRERQPDPELQEKLDSLYQNSVSREDLRHLASQLRHELEEHVQKQVPAAAAKVIRDEIMALLQEDQEQK